MSDETIFFRTEEVLPELVSVGISPRLAKVSGAKQVLHNNPPNVSTTTTAAAAAAHNFVLVTRDAMAKQVLTTRVLLPECGSTNIPTLFEFQFARIKSSVV